MDLSTWAIFMVRIDSGLHKYCTEKLLQQNGYPSKTTPPPKLKLSNKKDSDPTSGSQPAPTVPAVPAVMAAPTVNPVMPAMHPFGIPFPPWWAGPYQTPAPPPPPKARYDDIPSSDPIEDMEDVTLFPRISDWLQALDTGPRGQDEHHFVQFTGDFAREKYVRIVDLVDVTIGDLQTLIPEIAQGTAKRLLDYAVKDVETIRRKEKRRARQERNNYH